MNDFNEIEIIPCLIKNVQEDIKTFEDVLNLDSALRRDIYIDDIEPGVGRDVEAIIRYWNLQDQKNIIPITDREPIKIYIDSCGGCLDDTLTIIDAIGMSKTPIIGICIGNAYSGGFFIFISCPYRIAYPHSSFLFHEGSTQNGGSSGQFENYAAFYKRQLGKLKQITLSHTNISDEEYEKIKRDDIWYDVSDGVEKGFIDKVADSFI